MERLSVEAQVFLQCAACLGSSFAVETIEIIWQHQRVTYVDSPPSEKGTEELLMAMVEENYLEKPEKDKYR
eukprot:15338385-Ditylum_brightwellii.AAC.1